VIVRTSASWRRSDGSYIKFDGIAVLIKRKTAIAPVSSDGSSRAARQPVHEDHSLARRSSSRWRTFARETWSSSPAVPKRQARQDPRRSAIVVMFEKGRDDQAPPEADPEDAAGAASSTREGTIPHLNWPMYDDKLGRGTTRPRRAPTAHKIASG